jgi:hypothetical protein
MDGLLFLIKHLITLRERISPFEIEFFVREKNIDLAHLKGFFFIDWKKKFPFFFY